MPNKTIYLRQGEVSTWNRAKRIAELKGENISNIIAIGLAQYNRENGEIANKIERLLKSEKMKKNA